MGAYDSEDGRLVGTSCSEPIVCISNNDVPKNAPYLAMHIPVSPAWPKWQLFPQVSPRANPLYHHLLKACLCTHDSNAASKFGPNPRPIQGETVLPRDHTHATKSQKPTRSLLQPWQSQAFSTYALHCAPLMCMCHAQHPPAPVAIAPAPATSAAPATTAAADSAAPAVALAAATITAAAAAVQRIQQAPPAKAPAPAAPSSPGRSASPRSATSQAYLSQPLPPCRALSTPQPSLAVAPAEWEGDSPISTAPSCMLSGRARLLCVWHCRAVLK